MHIVPISREHAWGNNLGTGEGNRRKIIFIKLKSRVKENMKYSPKLPFLCSFVFNPSLLLFLQTQIYANSCKQNVGPMVNRKE